MFVYYFLIHPCLNYLSQDHETLHTILRYREVQRVAFIPKQADPICGPKFVLNKSIILKIYALSLGG